MYTTMCLNVCVSHICHYKTYEREAQYSNEGAEYRLFDFIFSFTNDDSNNDNYHYIFFSHFACTIWFNQQNRNHYLYLTHAKAACSLLMSHSKRKRRESNHPTPESNCYHCTYCLPSVLQYSPSTAYFPQIT